MNAPEIRTLTVTELNTLAKDYLENLPLFRNISVKGELSNVTLHRTGHIYFSIKDEGAAVSAVMWRSDVSSLGFTPENGQKVTAEGRVTLWVQRGQYTFNVRSMRKDGAGDLFAAFEELKRRLAAEGLFDASRKKPLPKYPRTVGIITAPTGAAIRDMINVTGRRFPLAKILLYPTLVQGDGAAPQMIEALRAFNREKKADVIILGRGGGSTEDLWAFNEEVVARAIARCHTPVVSAVGHETDVTIADFVADVRAPTPSAAAELAVPERGALLEAEQSLLRRMNAAFSHQLAQKGLRLAAAQKRLEAQSPAGARERAAARLAAALAAMDAAMRRALTAREHALRQAALRLSAAGPVETMRRGYAVVLSGGKAVRTTQALQAGDALQIVLADGRAGAQVTYVEKGWTANGGKSSEKDGQF